MFGRQLCCHWVSFIEFLLNQDFACFSNVLPQLCQDGGSGGNASIGIGKSAHKSSGIPSNSILSSFMDQLDQSSFPTASLCRTHPWWKKSCATLTVLTMLVWSAAELSTRCFFWVSTLGLALMVIWNITMRTCRMTHSWSCRLNCWRRNYGNRDIDNRGPPHQRKTNVQGFLAANWPLNLLGHGSLW